jgi:hypothetical protein
MQIFSFRCVYALPVLHTVISCLSHHLTHTPHHNNTIHTVYPICLSILSRRVACADNGRVACAVAMRVASRSRSPMLSRRRHRYRPSRSRSRYHCHLSPVARLALSQRNRTFFHRSLSVTCHRTCHRCVASASRRDACCRVMSRHRRDACCRGNRRSPGRVAVTVACSRNRRRHVTSSRTRNRGRVASLVCRPVAMPWHALVASRRRVLSLVTAIADRASRRRHIAVASRPCRDACRAVAMRSLVADAPMR